MKKGKRYLIWEIDFTGRFDTDDEPEEIKCLELSANGRIKCEFLHGAIRWIKATKLKVAEEL